MTFALISDVHANLAALQAVLARVAPDQKLYCLGDTVGYGAEPNECVDLVRERSTVTILGNHDVAAVDDHGVALFNEPAREAIRWTQTVLSQENLAWLDGLAYEFRVPQYLLVHGAPVDYFRYILTEQSARAAFDATDAPLVFVGHTHVAGYFSLDAQGTIVERRLREGGRLDFAPGLRYVVNVGSVGQPRDRNPDACFVRYDPAAGSVVWERVPYEIARTQRTIEAAHLPGVLAQRLAGGR